MSVNHCQALPLIASKRSARADRRVAVRLDSGGRNQRTLATATNQNGVYLVQFKTRIGT